jgi:hypothetical protein
MMNLAVSTPNAQLHNSQRGELASWELGVDWPSVVSSEAL